MPIRSVALLAAVLFSMGCTNLQKGAAIGGAAGGAIGMAYASIFSPAVNLAEGAAIGAFVGATGGALAGSDLDHLETKDLEREMQNLKDQLEAKNQHIAALQNDVGDVQKRMKDIDDLKKRLAQAEEGKEIDKLAKRLDEVEKKAIKDRDDEIERLKKDLEKFQDLAKALEKVEQTDRGLELTVVGDLLFYPGRADLTSQGKKALDAIATTLKENFPNQYITIEGHTDSQPIERSDWRSNWELGAARSQTALHYLINMHDLPPQRLSAATYGEYRPRAGNETATGMKKNRRAVIVVRNTPVDSVSNMPAQKSETKEKK